MKMIVTIIKMMMMMMMMVIVVMLKHHQVSDSQLEGRSCPWVRDGPTEGTGIYRDSEKLPQDESRPTKESISYGVFFVRVRFKDTVWWLSCLQNI